MRGDLKAIVSADMMAALMDCILAAMKGNPMADMTVVPTADAWG